MFKKKNMSMLYIFISYRKIDTGQYAPNIYKYLGTTYGKKNIFMDNKTIIGGDYWRKKIVAALNKANIVIVLIGKFWLAEITHRYYNKKDDYVRMELETSFQQGKLIIPLLFNGVQMPERMDLPISIQELSEIQGLSVRDGIKFNKDMNNIIESINNTNPEFLPCRVYNPFGKNWHSIRSIQGISNNGIYIAKLEQVVRDFYTINSTQEAYKFQLLIINPFSNALVFNRIEMRTIGNNPKDIKHLNTFAKDKNQQITLLQGEALRVIATTPLCCVLNPCRFELQLINGKKLIGEPVTFKIDYEFKQKTELTINSLPPSRIYPESRDVRFRGIKPREVLQKAIKYAQKWKQEATLRRIDSYGWKSYGDPKTRIISELEISGWLFIFAKENEVLGLIVDKDSIKEYQKAIPAVVYSGPTIERWNINVEEVIQKAGEKGVECKVGPNLRFIKVKDNWILFWIVSGTPRAVIDAMTGKVLTEEELWSIEH